MKHSLREKIIAAMQAIIKVHLIVIRYISCVPVVCQALPLTGVHSAAQQRSLMTASSPVTPVLLAFRVIT